MSNTKVVYGWYRNNEIFYVGIGSFNRSKSIRGRNPYCLRVRLKAEREGTFIIKILYKNLSYDRACKIEQELICKFGRIDLETGCLTNMTAGGDGCENLSPESRIKISQALRGKSKSKEHIEANRLAQTGKIMSKEARKNMSESQTGRKHTQKTKIKMSESARSRQPVVTPLGGFESINQAAEAHQVNRVTISRRCNNSRFTKYSFLVGENSI